MRSWPTGDRGPAVFLRQRRSLRALHLTLLRTQSARAVTVGGAVLAGDLRAARLEVGTPVTRARRTRLRSRGPSATMVRRDLLGLRRSPGSAATGLVLTGAAAYALVHASGPGTPSVIALAGLVLAYLGVSAWSEGLRLQGDNAGTPPLLGHRAAGRGAGPPRRSRTSATWARWPWSVGVRRRSATRRWSASAGPSCSPVCSWRPRRWPPSGVCRRSTCSRRAAASVTTVLWYAVPLLVPVVCGTAATALLTADRASLAVSVLMGTTYLAGLYARRRVRVLVEAHRA